MNDKLTLDSLKYSLHIILHPFDGFWDLKHEKRGNVKSATIIVLLLILVMILKTQLTGFLLNTINLNSVNIIQEILLVIAPFFLWCISNWCITTLMDGEGSLKDIAITTAYAMVPFILINIPLIVLSRLITIDEAAFYTLFYVISIAWSGFLLFIGIMTVHQFSVGKTMATIFIAILGMATIVFLCVLFVAIMQQLLGVIMVIYKEISMRK